MTSEVQSGVFITSSPNKWTLSRAKQWLKEHGLKLLKDKKERLCADSYMYYHYKRENEYECNDKEPSELPCEINLL